MQPGTVILNAIGSLLVMTLPQLQFPLTVDFHRSGDLVKTDGIAVFTVKPLHIGTDCPSRLLKRMGYLLPGGQKMARENYKTGGMVVHHLSDIYGFAAVADGPWGLWPLGGAWLAYHMWEHYLYTGDKAFLRDTAYEYIKNCAQFAIENMFEGKDGYLHTGPSTSPENRYIVDVNGEKKKCYIAVSPTMDLQIIGGLLDFYAECEDILAIDPEYAKAARAVRARMVPVQIGKAVIGFAGLGLIMVGIKAVLPYNDLSHVIRYGSLGIWFAAGAPAVMKLCFKKKGESK